MKKHIEIELSEVLLGRSEIEVSTIVLLHREALFAQRWSRGVVEKKNLMCFGASFSKGKPDWIAYAVEAAMHWADDWSILLRGIYLCMATRSLSLYVYTSRTMCWVLRRVQRVFRASGETVCCTVRDAVGLFPLLRNRVCMVRETLLRLSAQRHQVNLIALSLSTLGHFGCCGTCTRPAGFCQTRDPKVAILDKSSSIWRTGTTQFLTKTLRECKGK